MNFSAQVLDSVSGSPLPGATISIDGKPVAIADNNGNFMITPASDGVTLSISYVGYDPVELPLDMVGDTAQITMNRTGGALPEVSVVAKLKSNPVPYLLAAGGIGLLLFSGKKKKRVGKIDTSVVLIAGAAAAAVYFLTRRPAAPSVPVYSGPVYNPYAQPQQNQTAQDISAGASGLTSIISSLSNAGVF